MALVVGEAGIGKTRLVEEALAGVDRQAVRVLRGDATEHDLATFGLWQGVERKLGGDRPDPTLPPSERRWELLEHLAAGLATSPTVVVLEDLHWADEASLWVLERLVPDLAGAPVALVCTSRPEEPSAERLGGVRRLASVRALAGLDPEALDALAASVLPGGGADGGDLHRRTGGNPLFARELLVAGAGGDLPTAVADVLGRSLDRLDPALRPAVLAVALASPGTALSVVAAAVGLEPMALEVQLDRAASAGILRREAGRPVGFRHVLLAEAAIAAATPAARSDLHLRLAEAWAEQFPSPLGAAEAAAHRLSALPLGDAVSAGAAAVSAVDALQQIGDLPRLVGLARTAVAALDRTGSGDPVDRLRLAVALADALDALGEGEAAVAAYEEARRGVGPTTDPVLAATVELGAARWVNPFMPHVEQLARLRAVDAALPPGDSALRARLLARLGVLQCSSPGGPAAARADGDAAVAMARRLGDAELLVEALIDRHLVPVSPGDWDARGAAGEEVVALGERLARPDLALLGHEVTFLDRLDRGKRDAAEEALVRMEAYAQVLPSPRWRWTAAIRRSEFCLMTGDREGFLESVARGADLGRGVGSSLEVVGVELGLRATASVLWGIEDPLLAERHDELAVQAAHIPASFIQIIMAVDHLAFGDRAALRPVVDRYAPRPGAVLEQMQGLHALAILGSLVAEVGAVEHAATLHAELAPFEDRLGMTMPIGSTLGRLALALGDVPASLAHHERAVATATELRSPTLLAWAEHHRAAALDVAGEVDGAAAARAAAARHAAGCGVRLPGADVAGAAAATDPSATRRGPSPRAAAMARTGATWRIRSPHGEATIPSTAGVVQLAQILAAAGAEVAATTLAGIDAAPVPVEHDLGPALDATAKRQYRARITELRADIEEAEANNDPDRATLAQLELDAFLRELSAAVGLGGRDRPQASGAEKARINVTRSVRRAIAAVAAELPDLGAHLDRSVRTGTRCAYEPDPASALTWEISA